MDTNRFSLARKITLWLSTLLGLILLTGCKLTLTNLTPATLPENPSQIYTLSLRVNLKNSAVVPGSTVAHVIVDGQSYKMAPSPLGEDIYEFEYQLPAGRDELRYYYLVTYKIEHNGLQKPREVYSELQGAKVIRRYVLSLEANRGPVGARVSIFGRGFTPQDQVYFDETPTRVIYDSPSSLSFFVPALEPNRNYRVSVGGTSGLSFVGTFRIDAANIQVSPGALALQTGERQTLTFTVPNAAPAGGLLLDVTTDIPESVIMPEVVVPAGQTTVTVTIEGGKPGNGALYLKGFGAGEVTIPVSVGR